MRMSAVVASLVLAGCVSLNEGAVSYRRADPPNTISVSDYQRRAGSNNQPVLPARLVRQNMSLADAGYPSQPFLPDDQISIRLDFGFIDGSMSEFPFAIDRLENFNNPFIQRGEIVILANAFEFPEAAAAATPPVAAQGETPSTPAAPQDRFYFDEASLANARVIFYSNDVHAQQGLNFSNIPLLGPVEYHGRPIGIQLIILELDGTSPEMEGLLGSLAEIGSSAADAQGPLASALFSMGESLIATGTDDTLMRFTMVLDPQADESTGARVPAEVSLLEEGRMVFFRRENRSHPVDWESLRLDHNDGRLYTRRPNCDPTGNQCYDSFTGETYLTLNVINAGRTGNNASYNYQTYRQLTDALESTETNPTEIVERMRADARTYANNQRVRELRDDWRQLRERYTREYMPLLRRADQTCENEISDIETRRMSALFEVHTDAHLLWTDLKALFERDGLSAQAQALVLSAIADFGLASDAAQGFTVDELSAANFKTTFLAPDSPTEFINRLDAAASRRAPMRCPGTSATNG
jgi:hypothetical protein